MGKLINKIPGLRSLPGSSLRTHVESLSKPRDVKALPGKLDIKRHSSSILYLFEDFPYIY